MKGTDVQRPKLTKILEIGQRKAEILDKLLKSWVILSVCSMVLAVVLLFYVNFENLGHL